MPKLTKKDIEEIRGTILRTGEFRVHIKFGRGNENGNTCYARLWHPDGPVLSKATGAGYDMRGSVLGDAIEVFFQPELWALNQSMEIADQRNLGIRDSDDVKTVDGAIGLETMLRLLEALGYKARRFETGKDACMILAEKI